MRRVPVQGKHSWISGMDHYKEIWRHSVESPREYWGKVAETELEWMLPFHSATGGSLQHGDPHFFAGGRLNVCANAVDRWARIQPHTPAFLWEGDELGDAQSITYAQLQRRVSRMANALKEVGVSKGVSVAIYAGMVPESVYAMLACARLGAVHNVVFTGFSAGALAARLKGSGAKVLVTADEAVRGGKRVPVMDTVHEALKSCPDVHSVFVHQRTHTSSLQLKSGRDTLLAEALQRQRPYCPPVSMDSEDPLFIMYTSGSTGAPKGIVHTSGGYAVNVAHSAKMVFDLKPATRMGCCADVAWITGHSYLVYGPLLNGSTSLIFESVPTYPNASRYWEMVERLKLQVFYTSPTAVRALMKFDESHTSEHDLSSLECLATAGEPIQPAAWHWLYEKIGKRKLSLLDTYWQTETGSIMVSGIKNVTPMQAGSAGMPMPGVSPNVDGDGLLSFTKAWPSVARTIHGDHERYMRSYITADGGFLTGDRASMDKDGFMTIGGRTDDVINKAGHRLGSAEIEGVLVGELCVEAAVVSVPDNVMGERIIAFVLTKAQDKPVQELIGELKHTVRHRIGAIAVPDIIYVVDELPKTRSGKIVRRLLKQIAQGETDDSKFGDTSTLADPSVIRPLIKVVKG